LARYDFDQVLDRRNSDSVKWNAYPEDVIPLWVADMDFVSPQPVIEALRERVEHGVFGYPAGVGNQPGDLPEFRRLLVDRMARRFDWIIEPQDILLLPGVIVGFNLASYCTAVPGSGVMIQTPVYPPILRAAQETSCMHQEMELTWDPDGSYSVDWQVFEESLTPGTSTFILCNPHNPIGRVFRRDELLQMADICLRKNIVICSDEIHADLVYPEHPHIPIASLSPEIAQNTITLIAPSKTYNLAGLQCSIAIIQNPQLREKYLDSRKGLVAWVNLMGLTAAEAAYQHGDEWLSQVLEYLRANRDFVYEFVNRELPGVRMACPEGTYLAWLDCREAGIEGNAYQYFLEKARVALQDGASFGKGGEGFARLNFGTRRSLLEEALDRMKHALLHRAS
jgi:cysteine-S-conjugate beta-lyase